MMKLKKPKKLHLSLKTVKPLSSVDLERVQGGGESCGCSIETSPDKTIGTKPIG